MAKMRYDRPQFRTAQHQHGGRPTRLKSFKAQYKGSCKMCSQEIRPSMLIQRRRRGYAHADCAAEFLKAASA